MINNQLETENKTLNSEKTLSFQEIQKRKLTIENQNQQNQQLNFIFQEEKTQLNKQIENLQKEKEQIQFNYQNQAKEIIELQNQIKSFQNTKLIIQQKEEKFIGLKSQVNEKNQRLDEMK
jgi:hypothetical protein